jgi:hypothetical protein
MSIALITKGIIFPVSVSTINTYIKAPIKVRVLEDKTQVQLKVSDRTATKVTVSDSPITVRVTNRNRVKISVSDKTYVKVVVDDA